MSTPATTDLLKPFVPLDALDSDLLESWQAVSQATHRFLVLLREFDLRQGWRPYGNTDCAQWLNWRCGISRNTAQEKVRVPLVENGDGEPLNVGRKQRTVPTALRRALLARDRACTFPGCHHERFLDAHHIHHWAEGGETRLDNLLTLCTHHHALVHEGGFGIERHPDGRYYFTRPDGRPVEATPSVPENQVQETPPPYRLGLSSAEDPNPKLRLVAVTKFVIVLDIAEKMEV